MGCRKPADRVHPRSAKSGRSEGRVRVRLPRPPRVSPCVRLGRPRVRRLERLAGSDQVHLDGLAATRRIGCQQQLRTQVHLGGSIWAGLTADRRPTSRRSSRPGTIGGLLAVSQAQQGGGYASGGVDAGEYICLYDANGNVGQLIDWGENAGGTTGFTWDTNPATLARRCRSVRILALRPTYRSRYQQRR